MENPQAYKIEISLRDDEVEDAFQNAMRGQKWQFFAFGEENLTSQIKPLLALNFEKIEVTKEENA